MMDDEILLTRHIIPENTEEAKRTLIDMASSSSKEMMLHDVPTFIFDHIEMIRYSTCISTTTMEYIPSTS